MGAYSNPPIGELAKELAAGLLRLQKGYVDAAEAFLGILEPNLEYPYDLVVYRLTGYRPRGQAIQGLSGSSLVGDLQQLILDLCESFDLPAEAYSEPSHDLAGLARHLQISTKTIQRWRTRGLVARKMIFEPGRKRLGFLMSSVEAFAQREGLSLNRSSRFTQMTDREREAIIGRARRLVQRTDCCLNDISRHLAMRTGRAMETIRYTIRNHDLRNPDGAVFPQQTLPLDDAAHEVIYRCFLQGVAVSTLGRRYGRTRGSIYRIVNEMRARQLRERPIEYVYNPQFDLPGAEEMILADPVEGPSQPPRPVRVPKDLPPYLQSLYEHPLLTSQMEQALFRRMNFLKYQADKLCKSLEPTYVQASQLRLLERLLVQADAVKNQIIRANLRLVVSIAKKHVQGPQDLFELISDGNVSLMRAVEKFDYSRGFKFSTYGSWAVMKNFARSVPRERYLLDRFVTGNEDIVDLAGVAAKYDPRAATPVELRDSLQVVLTQLSPRERSIIVSHYGLGGEEAMPHTLEELSKTMGISKERVRQIEQRAMRKLKEMLSPVQSDLLT